MGEIFAKNLSDEGLERIFVVEKGEYKRAEINGPFACVGRDLVVLIIFCSE